VSKLIMRISINEDIDPDIYARYSQMTCFQRGEYARDTFRMRERGALPLQQAKSVEETSHAQRAEPGQSPIAVFPGTHQAQPKEPGNEELADLGSSLLSGGM
jgi:hypothetical protein